MKSLRAFSIGAALWEKRIAKETRMHKPTEIIAASNDFDVRSKESFSNFCIEYIIKYVNERKKSLLRNLKYKKWNYGFTFLYVLEINFSIPII